MVLFCLLCCRSKIITFLQDEELTSDLLYQGEFVKKKKIGIISLFELSQDEIKKNKHNFVP